MFRIEIFVDDRKLAFVLRALVGQVVSMSAPQPVANAKRGKNGVEPVTTGNPVETFAKFVKGKTEITPTDVREYCRTHGYSEKSYSSVLAKMMEAGLVKRTKKPGGKGVHTYRYTVHT